VPRSLSSPGRCSARTGCYPLSERFVRSLPDLSGTQFSRWIRPVSLGRLMVREHRLGLRHDPVRPFVSGSPAHAFNAPTQPSSLLTGPISRPKSPRIQGRRALHPLPQPADGVVILEPFWERPAGTQTHSRRTVLKLGQLRDARQGLVRVPESNTKYGGKRRKTGVSPRLLLGQVSVSPQGFPSEKNCFGRAVSGCARCSQDRYFLRPWDCALETHVRLRIKPGRYPRRPVV
jgi:hypothetical protein